MTWLQLVLLSLIQGLTEFLPVSSSAHLILPSQLLGWPDQGPMVDVMAHFGSLFAVLGYFRRDVARLLRGGVDLLRRDLNADSVLALNLVLATPPALVFGYVLGTTGGLDALRNPWLIAATTSGFGVLLWLVDRHSPRTRTAEDLRWRDAVGLGFAQAVALVPGTSRSGITMTLGRGLGLTRVEAARFSMLMSLPVIGAGGLYAITRLSEGGGGYGVSLADGLIVAGLSFAAAYAAIAAFMRWVPRVGMFPFMIYRLGLAATIVAVLMV